jgi:adenosine deaminase
MHLRGAIPLKILGEFLEKYDREIILSDLEEDERNFREDPSIRKFLELPRWSIDDVTELFSYHSIEHFLLIYGLIGCFIRDISDLKKLIYGVFDRLKAQNIVYAEITVSLLRYLERGITPEEIRDCLDEAAEDSEIKVRWIVDLFRNQGQIGALKFLNKIIEMGSKSIAGITLGGTEKMYPPRLFQEIYSNARKNGLRLTVHAGETLGPQSIWNAIEILQTERIGHGVKAKEDEELMKFLSERKIPLEISLTSNVQTEIVPSYFEHPVKKFYDAGIPVTINTDDPTFFETTLSDEYMHLLDIGIGIDGIYEILQNGFKYSFLPPEEKEYYLKMLKDAWNKIYSFQGNH